MSATVADGRQFRLGLLVATAGALTLRVAVYLSTHRGVDPWRFNDEPYYSRQAFDLADGVLFRDPRTGGPGAEHGPLTAVLLAPFSWFDSFDAQRVGSIVIGVAAVAVIGLVGRRLGGPRMGVGAAAVAAAYPNLWLNDGIIMSESSAALTVSTWLLLGLRWRAQPTAPRSLAWGAAGGVAALARSELSLLVIASVVLVVLARPSRRRQLGALVVAGTIAVTGPWVTWNLTRFERVVVLTTNAGATLRGANCDETYSGRAVGGWSIRCLVLNGRAVVRMETSVRAERWQAEAFDYIGRHLDEVPSVVLARAARLLDVAHLAHMVDDDVRDRRPRWGSWLGVVSWWFAAPVAAIGVIGARRFQRALLVTPVAVAAFSALAFYGSHRIRTPLEPVVVLGVALGISRLRRRLLRSSSVPELSS